MDNRLNSHDTRLACVETGKPDAGKGAGGGEDQGVDDDIAGGEDDADGGDTERDRTWAVFRDRAIRERERYDRGFNSRDQECYDRREWGRYDRDFYSRGARD
jgi:hypothetical protein